MRASAILLALALLPSALAHEGPYDPLIVDLHAFPTADGRIDERAPDAGALAFPAGSPAAPGEPLRFSLASPVRFAPGAAFAATIAVRAESLVVARDADGNAFEVNVLPGGEPVRVALDAPVLAPGTIVRLSAQVHAAGATYDEGAELALTVRALMPLGAGALSLLVGPDASRFDAPQMRVPAPADLRLQPVPHTEFLLESERFEPPPDHAVNEILVAHDAVTPPAQGAWSPNGTYVVLRGEEPDATANAHTHANATRRVEAAHEFRVNGVPARAHPGLGVVVRVISAPIHVECVRGCAQPFSWTHAPPTPVGAEPPSALVPPPRDTRGIPASGDEPAGKETPLFPALALLALVVAALSKR